MPPSPALLEIATTFLRIGVTAFGGPAAHIAMMDRELVQRKQWLDRETFLHLVAASNLIPGPNSTELAIHIGYKRGGWAGLVVAGLCFIFPAATLVGLGAWFYVQYGAVPAVQHILYGVQPVIVAIIAAALLAFGRTSLRNAPSAIIAAGSLALLLAGVNELPLLLLGGITGLFLHRASQIRLNTFLFPLGILPAAHIPAGLFLSFLKIGSILFGSGYVLLAFLRDEFVERGLLTEQQLLDAIAFGQFTPGPVFTTATFIGYLLDGAQGAIWATVGIFLPAFFFVALTAPFVDRLRASMPLKAFLDGVVAASLALMAAVLFNLGASALHDPVTVVLAVVSFGILLRWNVNSAFLVIAGGGVGYLIS